MSLSTDPGDVSRANALEAKQRTALTEGVAGLSTAVMTAPQYTDVARNVNDGMAGALFSTLRAVPMRLMACTMASLPSPSDNLGCLIFVANGAGGGPVVAFSDGHQWLRCDTLAPCG